MNSVGLFGKAEEDFFHLFARQLRETRKNFERLLRAGACLQGGVPIGHIELALVREQSS